MILSIIAIQKNKETKKRFLSKRKCSTIAQYLLGYVIFTNIEWNICSVIIARTEAYSWTNDKAYHWKIYTSRTKIMFWEWWNIYTYLCYGLRILTNIVTNIKWKIDAVLVHAIFPISGFKIIPNRYKNFQENKNIIWPWKVSKALWISLSNYWENLTWDKIQIEKWYDFAKNKEIIIWPRIWIGHAWEEAILLRRFKLKKYTK